MHRLGGVAEVGDEAHERVVAVGLSAEGREDLALSDGSKVKSVTGDANGHHYPV